MRKISDILADYVRDAAGQVAALNNADHKTANRYAKRILRLEQEVTAYEEAGTAAMASLLDHPADGVKYWAAAFLLNTNPAQSVPVLEELAEKKNLLAATSFMTLKSWRGPIS